jgi:hypothetical protein
MNPVHIGKNQTPAKLQWVPETFQEQKIDPEMTDPPLGLASNMHKKKVKTYQD